MKVKITKLLDESDIQVTVEDDTGTGPARFQLDSSQAHALGHLLLCETLDYCEPGVEFIGTIVRDVEHDDVGGVHVVDPQPADPVPALPPQP